MMDDSVYITTDKSKINLKYVHEYLSTESYWAKGRSLDSVILSIENSMCFSMFLKERETQIGFARVATDYVVFAWIMDVFIEEKFRGKGYSKLLMNHILEHPELKQVNGFGLRTDDAQGLYNQFGFSGIPEPESWMFKKNKK